MENSRASKNSSYSGSSSSSSSSSIAYELFGPKESSSTSAAGSYSSIFGSVFGPPLPTVSREVNSSKQHYYSSETHQPRNLTEPTAVAASGYNYNNKETSNNNQYYQQHETTIQPCHYSSSIYYGGQDVYEFTPSSSSSQPNKMKRDGAADSGPDGGTVNGTASRGNWWQGSLYY